MFGRKQRKQSVVDSLIGLTSRVNGDLNFEGGCHIAGTVKGNVSADPVSSSALSISEEGTIEGSVAVPRIIMPGIVRGDVYTSQRIEFGSTARVIGDVYYNLIEVAIGAEIHGKLVYQPEGQVPLVDSSGDEIESPVQAVSSS